MRVIAFTGLPGSGKSVAVEAVRARGIPVARMGDHVLAEVQRRGLPLVEGSIGPVATEMRRAHGPAVWAERTVQALRSGAVPGVDVRTPLVTVDGVRSLAEVDCFIRMLGADFTLVAIEAPEKVRHARILDRGRTDDAPEATVVAQRDARERGWGVEEAMARADHILHNNGGLEEFQTEITALLDRLLQKADF